MTVTYSCPNDFYTLGSYPDGNYCLFLIKTFSYGNNITFVRYSDTANQYCYNMTGGYLASIHSEEENNDILQTSLNANITRVMIGLMFDSSEDSYYWLDGTNITYTNYNNEGSCYTTFIHLLGWTLNADILSTFDVADDNDCGTECALTANCTGFQMVRSTGKCNLLTMVRCVTFEPNQCGYYLKQSSNVTVESRRLDGIDALIQNAVYDSQSACPDGWTATASTCTLAVTKAICDEYASFLAASWDGTTCVIPYMTVNYSCPNASFTLGSYPDGSYCYILIETLAGNHFDSINAVARETCYTTGGYLASIHSEAENNDIHTLQSEIVSNKTVGVMIGLTSNNSVITSADDFYWQDGTDITYMNYYGEDLNMTYNGQPIIMLPASGKWKTVNSQSSFHFIACKQTVKAIMTFT